jgi:hypothetical protein
MIYFQNTNKQTLFGNVPQDNVAIFVIIIIKMKELKKRWGITSNFQLAIIFICYYWLYLCLDFETSLYVWNFKRILWFILILLLFIFPLYQVLLVCIGAV